MSAPSGSAPDGSDFLFDIRDEHLNGGGALHGGMMMALADIVMGRTRARRARRCRWR